MFRSVDSLLAVLLRELRRRNASKTAMGAHIVEVLAPHSDHRTPLGSIPGWTSALSRQTEPHQVERGLASIERSTKSLARLVDDLLDVTRIDVAMLPMARSGWTSWGW
jgi:signal transduction histidine kinase